MKVPRESLASPLAGEAASDSERVGGESRIDESELRRRGGDAFDMALGAGQERVDVPRVGVERGDQAHGPRIVVRPAVEPKAVGLEAEDDRLGPVPKERVGL